MTDRVYYDKNGKPNQLPVGQENGKLYRTTKYIDRDNKCPECGWHVFYTKNGNCWKCCQARACDLFSYVNGLMEIDQCFEGFYTSYDIKHAVLGAVGNRIVPSTFKQELEDLSMIFDISAPSTLKQAADKGLDLWVTGDPCSKAGHYGIRTLENKCYFCEQERNKPKPRQVAISKGESWYTPNDPCAKCGQTAEKNVHTGACRGCKGTKSSDPGNDARETDDSIMMKANPDMIVSRNDAISLKMKVYRHGRPCKKGHTGYRYVSTNSCIDCLRQKPEVIP